jgi:hypothetical protein
MKQFYKTILLLLIFSGTQAQPYRPMLDSINVWSYSGTLIPVNQQNRQMNATATCQFPLVGTNMRYLTSGDTVIFGNPYKILFADVDGSGNLCHQGYIREDTATRKVYFTEPILTPERLLYNFGMQQGDSIYVAGGNQFDYFPAGYYVLDTIQTFPLASGPTRAFYLYNPNAQPFSSPMIWLEGIGFPGEVVYDIPSYNYVFGLYSSCTTAEKEWYGYEKILTCFEHAQKVYFDTCAHSVALGNASCFNILDSCNYYNICGSVTELSSINSFRINPNPVVDEAILEIEASKTEKIQINVLNVSGKLTNYSVWETVSPGTQKIKLNTAELLPGIYLVRLSGSRGEAYTKMIKL